MNDDDYYFRAIVDLEIINEKLYAIDNWGHHLLSFSIKEGISLEKKIGQQGQGPGDLQYPGTLSIGSGEVAVKDNNGISFFSLDGKFKRKFKTYRGPKGFAFINRKIFRINPDPDSDYLIEIYSDEGKKLSHFGKKFCSLDFSLYKGISPNMVERLVFEGILFTKGNFIYYLSKYFGILNQYDLEGKRIAETDIVNIFNKHEKEVLTNNQLLWLKNGITLDANNRKVECFTIFQDAYLSGTKIYLLEGIRALKLAQGKQKHCIKEIDVNSLEVTNEYCFKRIEDEHAISLAVLATQDGMKFYISMIAEDYVIREYVIDN